MTEFQSCDDSLQMNSVLVDVTFPPLYLVCPLLKHHFPLFAVNSTPTESWKWNRRHCSTHHSLHAPPSHAHNYCKLSRMKSISSAIVIAVLAVASCMTPTTAVSVDGALNNILSGKGLCVSTPYGVYTDVHAHISANIAIDFPLTGLPFAGFINDILSMSDLVQLTPSTSTVLQVLSDSDARVKLSPLAEVSLALPQDFTPLTTQFTIGGRVAIGFNLEVQVDASANLAATLVSPILTADASGSFDLVKLENGQFYRRVGASIDANGHLVAELGSNPAGTYFFARVSV
ncbi:hypothetical protein PROFUN_02054 [Planoprotostelium fungivorum]|uniref:Uncharacterized protein n=1 Tax=Planoprotostelium fungivorum TaxID=1890364 RepID=A0A2P6NB92_9EUKA|nr:hypothetical protein PROFUN_02054 [Planoprotostelium fungivorum]